MLRPILSQSISGAMRLILRYLSITSLSSMRPLMPHFSPLIVYQIAHCQIPVLIN